MFCASGENFPPLSNPVLVNWLYGFTVGDNVNIGAFVEIQKGVRVGNDCKISSHSFLCEGVSIEDGVFIGHGVMFINDLYPEAVKTPAIFNRRPIGK